MKVTWRIPVNHFEVGKWYEVGVDMFAKLEAIKDGIYFFWDGTRTYQELSPYGYVLDLNEAPQLLASDIEDVVNGASIHDYPLLLAMLQDLWFDEMPYEFHRAKTAEPADYIQQRIRKDYSE